MTFAINALTTLAQSLKDNPYAAQVLTVGMVCALAAFLTYITKR